MDLDELLRCLAEAESGEFRPELTGGRYVAVEYVRDGLGTDGVDPAQLFGAPGAADAGAVWEADEEFEDEDEEVSFEVLGTATSFYEALDLLGGALNHDEWLEEFDEEEAEDGDGRDKAAAVLRELRTPQRRAVVYLLAGALGPMDIVTEDFEDDVYLGYVARQLPGARFLMLASAAPPHQEVAYAILELQPGGTPGPADRALLEASATGDLTALRSAISEGADVNALDACGATPLHHAVAARQAEAVDALLAAGADPRIQLTFGNAPQFATAGRAGLPNPTVSEIEGWNHWSVLWSLLDAGAEINAVNTAGQTLLDLAIRSEPYPEREVSLLLKRGATSQELRDVRVDSLVQSLPYGYEAELRVLKNRLRFLLDTGAQYVHPLDALLATTGYYERELSGDYLVELVDIMVSRGVRDRPGTYGRTARERAQSWVEHGLTHYKAVVDRLAAAADGTA